MHACAQEHAAAFRRVRVNELHGTDVPTPLFREVFGKLFRFRRFDLLSRVAAIDFRLQAVKVMFHRIEQVLP